MKNMKKLYLLFLIIALIFMSCYFTNIPVYPSYTAFHDIDILESPFSAVEERITGMANNGEIVTAVGSNGTIAYSLDHGVNWKKADLLLDIFPDGIAFNDICRSEKYFLAVGDSGKAAWSNNGIEWQFGVIGPMSPKNILSVSAGKMGKQHIFLAGGTDGRIAYALNSPQGPWYQVSFSPFGDKENEGESVNAIGFGTVKSIGIFVAAGDNGKIAIMNDTSGRMYGPTGAGTRQAFRGVAFGNDRFIAVGDGALMKVSPDPESYSWLTIHDSDFGMRPFLKVDFDPSIEKFVLVTTNAVLGFSETGERWSATTFPNSDSKREISAVTCTKRRIVIGFSDGSIMYSN